MDSLTSQEINIALLSLGGLVLVLGLLSGFLKKRLYISEPMVTLVAGVLLSPAVFGLLNLTHWGKPEMILEEGARLAIAIQVMGVALRLPKAYPWNEWRSLAVLLGPVMLFMWLCSGLLVYLILGLPFWEAMLVGAVITPTDPVIATSIVTGKVAEQNLPERIRNLISAESAANDGLGYLFVFLPILMLTRSPTEAFSHWLTKTLLWEVGAAIILGAILGYLAGKFLLWSEEIKAIEKNSFLAYSLALSLTVLSLVKLLGSDGILSVFVTGIVFSTIVSGGERSEEEGVQEAVDRFFTLYIFVLFGLALPWQKWLELGWAAVFLVVAVFLLRRLPALLLLSRLIGQIRGKHDASFIGWFGPIGVAAIYYAMLSQKETGLESPWIIGSLAICISIFVHGFTATPFAQIYGKKHDRSMQRIVGRISR